MRHTLLVLLSLGTAGCLPDATRSLAAYEEEVAAARDAAPGEPADADGAEPPDDLGAAADGGTPDAFDRAPPLCSENGGVALVVAFNNRYADKRVAVLWVDGGCNEREYARLDPGQTHIQNTFTLHAWRLRDADTGALILYWRAEAGAQGPARVTVP